MVVRSTARSGGEVRRVRDAARQAGVGFSAVGSPIGKFPLAGDFAEERERMCRALEFAALLEAPYVRIFGAGFAGFLTLEPHLNVASGSYGAGAAPYQLLSRQGRRGRDPHGGTRRRR